MVRQTDKSYRLTEMVITIIEIKLTRTNVILYAPELYSLFLSSEKKKKNNTLFQFKLRTTKK